MITFILLSPIKVLSLGKNGTILLITLSLPIILIGKMGTLVC